MGNPIVFDPAPGSTNNMTLELRLKRIFDYLQSISPYVSAALDGTTDVGVLATADKTAVLGSKIGTFLKHNNYWDGRNDRFIQDKAASQLFTSQDLNSWYLRYNTNTPTTDGIIQWGTSRPIIPERGSNSNGEWIRFGDGTQICTIADGLFGPSPQVWTFPQAFLAGTKPVVSFVSHDPGYIHTADFAVWTNTQARVRKYEISNGAEYTGTLLGVDAIAIGRWF